MADLTIWNVDGGSGQGRSIPVNWAPPEGAYVFVLGHDLPGMDRILAIGDFVEVAQTLTIPASTTYMRIRSRMRGPTAMPPGTAWTFQILLDGVERYRRDLRAEEVRDFADIAVDLGGVVGDHAIGFKLTLTGGGVDPYYDIELPGVYIDSILFDLDTHRPKLICREPEPNWTAVRADSNIALAISDSGVDGIDVAHTSVYVGGVLAFAAGAFQAGFTGPGSSFSFLAGTTFRLTIDPVAQLAEGVVLPVHVLSQTATSALLLDETYTFTVEDLAPPSVVSAVALDARTVRVTFSEGVRASSATALNDALNPANYAFTRAPPAGTWEAAVSLAAASCAKVVDGVIDVTLDVDATRSAHYLLTVTTVEDLFGNAVLPPTNSAAFVGFQPIVPEGREFQLLDMLPDKNVDEDETEDLAKFIAIEQEVTDLLLSDIDGFPDILDPDTAPERFVDSMLRDLGNPFGFAMTLDEKRQLAQLLVPIYGSKGTNPGIINAIRLFMAIEVTITTPAFSSPGLGVATIGGTWVLGPTDIGSFYTIWINSPIGLTTAQRAQMLAIAKYMKAARIHVVIKEPAAPPPIPNHMVLGLSQLGLNWKLH